ncbi:MAG: hypothetical protein ACRYFK_16350 [Janthinobacterium lividum]
MRINLTFNSFCLALLRLALLRAGVGALALAGLLLLVGYLRFRRAHQLESGRR